MVTPAPAAVAVRNVRLEMSLMDVLARAAVRPRDGVNLPDPFTVYESINARVFVAAPRGSSGALPP